MTQLGGMDSTFTVKSFSGDLGISYNSATTAVQDRFERLPAGLPFQDTTAYVDFEQSGEVCSVELASDGAFNWNAGTGLILQIGTGGGLTFYERTGNQVPATPGPAAPASGRMRLRLIKGSASSSTLHVDSWDGVSFIPDLAVFSVGDDHRYRGLWTAVANYGAGRRGIRRVTIVHEMPPGSLILRKDPTWSADWKVFQRDASGHAAIPLRFYYRLDGAGRAQARVIRSSNGSVLAGHDYTNHETVLAASGGAGGSLDVVGVPTGGNYDVQVRLVRDSDGAVLGSAVLDEIAVGDVYLSAGQSNMSGYSGTLAGAESPIDEVHVFHNDNTWKRAVEPMDDGTDQVDKVSAEFPAHSLMLRFGKEVFSAIGVPIGVIPAPLGGTNLYSQWQRDESDHDNRGTLYGSQLYRGLLQSYATPVKGFLWFQGESDVGARTTQQYKNDLKRLIAEYREDLGNSSLYFLIAQLGTNDFSNLENWISIQEAQRQVVEEDPLTAIVTTVDQPRADTIHFTVGGYKTIGVRFAEAARELIYGEALDASLRLMQARSAGHGRKVELVYDGELTSGAANLFQVKDASGYVGIRSVTVSGNIATLDLDRAAGANPLVSYGFSDKANTPWLEDVRGTPVPCFRRIPVTP